MTGFFLQPFALLTRGALRAEGERGFLLPLGAKRPSSEAVVEKFAERVVHFF
jgi:hypothetical protein